MFSLVTLTAHLPWTLIDSVPTGWGWGKRGRLPKFKKVMKFSRQNVHDSGNSNEEKTFQRVSGPGL